MLILLNLAVTFHTSQQSAQPTGLLGQHFAWEELGYRAINWKRQSASVLVDASRQKSALIFCRSHRSFTVPITGQ